MKAAIRGAFNSNNGMLFHESASLIHYANNCTLLALYLTDLKNWGTKMSSISSNHSVSLLMGHGPHLKVRLTSETLVSLRHAAAFLLTE